MEVHQVRYFLAVCDTENFTRAAKQCHVSQPALTQAIKKLEDELGGPLFHREHGRVTLSGLGSLMRPRFEQMNREIDSATKEADAYWRFNKAPLNLGVMVTVGPLRLGRLLAEYQHANPGVEVAVREGDAASLSRDLALGKLELAILNVLGEPDVRLHVQPLYSERYLVVLPPGHPLEGQDEIRLADLTRQAYVDRLSCEMRDLVMATCTEKRIELYATYRSEREDWIQGMVLAGLGFAFLPEHSITVEGLTARPLVQPAVERTISVASMAGRRYSPAAKAFVRAAQSHRWDH